MGARAYDSKGNAAAACSRLSLSHKLFTLKPSVALCRRGGCSHGFAIGFRAAQDSI